jgi:hypothetical protein
MTRCLPLKMRYLTAIENPAIGNLNYSHHLFYVKGKLKIVVKKKRPKFIETS